jgi:hypothetical protein
MKHMQTKKLYSLLLFLFYCFFIGTNLFCEGKDNKKGDSMKDILTEVRNKAAEILYFGAPDKIRILQYKDSWLKGRPVFCCIDEYMYSVVFARNDEKNGWIRLSGVGDFSGMNKVLKGYSFTKDTLNDTKALIEFLRNFYNLYRNPYGYILSQEYIKDYEKYGYEGLLYLESNVEQFKALCIDPVTTTKGDIITIKFNVLTILGSVECWEIYGKHIKDHVIVDLVTISILKPTASYLFDMIR